tara:strand:- start:212 stop:1609 length:1398 start_codon:yes stop_codon:yes gene_type:complete
MANVNDPTRAGDIKRFQVFKAEDNSKDFVDFSAACVEFSYYEDILSNSVTATATIVESGLADSKSVEYKGALDNLPIKGGEPTNLIIEDNQVKPTQLKFVGKSDNQLYVNRVRGIDPGTQKDVYFIDLCSRELLTNEQVRVVKRYDGKISNNVKKILTESLGGDAKKDKQGLMTQKSVEVDETAENYNFIGNDRKPFYVCTWLASKSIPTLSVNGKNSLGSAAGYFFYETYEGFKFKSIDKLLQGNVSQKYILTNTPDLPKNYDAKILSVDIERDIDLQQNLTMGAYSNRTLFFNPVSYSYSVRDLGIDQTKDKVVSAGKKTFGEGVAPEFTNSPSRIMNRVMDIGTLPSGNTAVEQLNEWKDNPNSATFKSAETLAQSAMRYNQLFSIKTHVTIAGDFSLRAGQVIYCDFPELSVDSNKVTNKETGGKYLIVSVCHRMTPSDCYSRLTLVRDSFGRVSAPGNLL